MATNWNDFELVNEPGAKKADAKSGGATDWGQFELVSPAGVSPPETDGPLTRGFKKAGQSMKMTAQLAGGDTEGVAQTAQEAADYAQANPGRPEGQKLMDAWEKGDGVTGGIGNVARQIKSDYDETKGFLPALKAVGRDFRAMGEGVVEQVPNMIAPTIGLVGGAAAGGAAAGPAGAIAGGWAGASAGNALIEGGDQIQTALQQAGINPRDTQAVQAYVDANRDQLLKQTAIKGGVIGAVDTATGGLAHYLLTAPGKAAAGRALSAMGVDMADKAAVKAATQSSEFAQQIAGDAAYQASKKGIGNVARNATAAALEPAGEFFGEYVGQGLANNQWDPKNAALEALSSIGQSGAMFAGQKAWQYATNPAQAANGTESGVDAALGQQADAGLVQEDPQQAGADSGLGGSEPAAIAPAPDTASPGTETPQPAGEVEPPHRAMGIDPNAGPLSAGAAIAVDSGAAEQMQAAAQMVDNSPGKSTENNPEPAAGKGFDGSTTAAPAAQQDQSSGSLAQAAQAENARPTAGPRGGGGKASSSGSGSASQAWANMSVGQRESLTRDLGLPPIFQKNVSRARWEGLNLSLQDRIAKAMAPADSAGISTPAQGSQNGRTADLQDNARLAAQGGAQGRADVDGGAGDLVQRPDGAAGAGMGAASAGSVRGGAPVEPAGTAGDGRGAVGQAGPFRPKNLVQLVREAGGVSLDRKADVDQDSRTVGVFRKGGMDLDGLAELMQQHGFLTDADVTDTTSGAERAADLLRAALAGERVLSLNDVDAEAQYRDGIRQRAADYGIRTMFRPFGDIERDVLARDGDLAPEDRSAFEYGGDVAYTLEPLDDIDLQDARTLSEEDQLRMAGFSEDEINETINGAGIRESQGAPEQSQPGAAQESRNAGAQEDQSQEGNPEGLTRYTNEDIAQQEAAQRAAVAEAERPQREADQKAQADAERGSFTLTGSDRTTDVQAAQGQGGLFEQPAETKPTNLKNGLAKIRKEKAAQASTESNQDTTKSETRANTGLATEISTSDQVPVKKPADDFMLRPVEIMERLISTGEIKSLYKAAGVKSADAFGGLSLEDQANAYAKYVQEGGKPAPAATESYNDRVARQEREARIRRLQEDRTVTQVNGKPFKTEASARAFSNDNELGDTHEAAARDGGFVLQKLPPARRPSAIARQEQRRATDPETQRQDAAFARAEKIGQAAEAAVTAYENGDASIEEFEAALDAADQPAVGNAPSPLEALFSDLNSESTRKAKKAKKATAKLPQAARIDYVQANFHDILMQMMDAGALEVNGAATLTEDNKSCL